MVDKMLNQSLRVTELSYKTTRESLEVLKEEHQTGIGGRDSTIIASMRKEKIDKLMTHDQAFKKIDGIDVVDPINR